MEEITIYKAVDGTRFDSKCDCEYYESVISENKNKQSKKWILEYLYDGLRKSDEQFKGQFKAAIDWLEKQGKQEKQVHFPKFTFDDVLALQCCMETVKKVQEDKELYEQLNLIHSKMYDAYCIEKKGEQTNECAKNKQKSTDKIEPRFKVGDRIRHKETNKDDVYEVSKVYDDSYGIAGLTWMIYMKYQDQYELVPNRFDPKTLNPFDKVLVKISNESFNTWYADFVAEPSHVENETPLILGAKEANMVIPYNEETKHLVGTTAEAPEYYKYWED